MNLEFLTLIELDAINEFLLIELKAVQDEISKKERFGEVVPM